MESNKGFFRGSFTYGCLRFQAQIHCFWKEIGSSATAAENCPQEPCTCVTHGPVVYIYTPWN